jgi:hypothetical protein
MLLIVFALIIFAFLFVGAVVFVICSIVPPLRKRALSAALWWAVWGPCTVCWLIVGGIGLLAGYLAKEHTHLQQIERLPVLIGPIYVAAGLLGTVVIASILAWLHQFFIRRMTFSLFRIYACLVSAGIGSVYGWALNFWLIDKSAFPIAFVALPVICFAFGYVGFREAHQLRGRSPRDFTWITPQEFEGKA